MAKKAVEAKREFELSWFTKGGAARCIKVYEGMGYTKLSVREADGLIWVKFREP